MWGINRGNECLNERRSDQSEPGEGREGKGGQMPVRVIEIESESGWK